MRFDILYNTEEDAVYLRSFKHQRDFHLWHDYASEFSICAHDYSLLVVDYLKVKTGITFIRFNTLIPNHCVDSYNNLEGLLETLEPRIAIVPATYNFNGDRFSIDVHFTEQLTW